MYGYWLFWMFYFLSWFWWFKFSLKKYAFQWFDQIYFRCKCTTFFSCLNLLYSVMNPFRFLIFSFLWDVQNWSILLCSFGLRGSSYISQQSLFYNQFLLFKNSSLSYLSSFSFFFLKWHYYFFKLLELMA